MTVLTPQAQLFSKSIITDILIACPAKNTQELMKGLVHGWILFPPRLPGVLPCTWQSWYLLQYSVNLCAFRRSEFICSFICSSTWWYNYASAHRNRHSLRIIYLSKRKLIWLLQPIQIITAPRCILSNRTYCVDAFSYGPWIVDWFMIRFVKTF